MLETAGKVVNIKVGAAEDGDSASSDSSAKTSPRSTKQVRMAAVGDDEDSTATPPGWLFKFETFFFVYPNKHLFLFNT